MKQRRSIRNILRNMEKSVELRESQNNILRGGTERAFSSDLLNEKRAGTYSCVACGSELFSSDAKFDSGTGWPSFSDVMKKDALRAGLSVPGMGAEVKCDKCGGHLGHVFSDGPKEKGGKRFCINGEVLKFVENGKIY